MAERFRYTIFGKQQSFFLLVLLFPWAQIHPQNAWLGMGDLGIKALRISPYWSLPFNNATQELLITAVASSSLAALLLFATKTKAPQIRFILVVTGLTIALKVFASELQFGSNGMTIWWSISVGLGLGIGLLMLWFISHLTKVYLWWISFIGLIILLILVNTLPQDPYYLAQLEILPRGRLTNFNDLLKWNGTNWVPTANTSGGSSNYIYAYSSTTQKLTLRIHTYLHPSHDAMLRVGGHGVGLGVEILIVFDFVLQFCVFSANSDPSIRLCPPMHKPVFR